ncbi:MAG: hypothetical protein AAF363_11075 [Bacteroidota bacterium]
MGLLRYFCSGDRRKVAYLMPKAICCFFLFVCGLLISDACNAQFRNSPKRLIKRVEKYSCPILFRSNDTQGIGVKVGDPIGVTYKNYFRKRFAFEVAVGFAAAGFYSNFLEEEFLNLNPADFEGDSLIFLNRDIRTSAALQLRIIMHNPLPAGITGDTGVDWYVGLGINTRYLDVEYQFQVVDNLDPIDLNVQESREDFFLYGPEAILGLEYAIRRLRVTSFIEGSYFLNLDQIDSDTRFYGAMGFRYIF